MQQIRDEEIKLQQLKDELDSLKNNTEEKRKIFNDKRLAVDELRRAHQNNQHSQFEAEKKVAVADTNIQNLQRTLAQLEKENAQRKLHLSQLENEKQVKQKELEEKRLILNNFKSIMPLLKIKLRKHRL